MTKQLDARFESVVSPSFRGIEVGSNEGIENFKRGGIMAKQMPRERTTG